MPRRLLQYSIASTWFTCASGAVAVVSLKIRNIFVALVSWFTCASGAVAVEPVVGVARVGEGVVAAEVVAGAGVLNDEKITCALLCAFLN
jgi:hypothetical protein